MPGARKGTGREPPPHATGSVRRERPGRASRSRRQLRGQHFGVEVDVLQRVLAEVDDRLLLQSSSTVMPRVGYASISAGSRASMAALFGTL